MAEEITQQGRTPGHEATVVAVVVTYNRKELLAECLEAILAQTRVPDVVVLVDNASTDGTHDYVAERGLLDDPRMVYHAMKTNTGGSGGFHAGMGLAMGYDPAWVWVMDDDTIPTPGALQGLLDAHDALGQEVSFLASCVFGPDGEAMNVPNISTERGPNGYLEWYRHLPQGAVRLLDATFVSLLIDGDAIRSCGLPCKDYFIWGDDTEYTMRIIRNFGPAYLVGSSVVCHKRFNARRLAIQEEDSPGRIAMYRYFYRNILINKKMYQGKKQTLKFFVGALRSCALSLKTPQRAKKVGAILGGIGDFVTQHRRFERYVAQQLEKGAQVAPRTDA